MFDSTEDKRGVLKNAQTIKRLQQKRDFLKQLKKVFEAPEVEEHYASMLDLGKAYQINSQRVFENYAYEENTVEYQAFTQLCVELEAFSVDTADKDLKFCRKMLEYRTTPAISENFLVLINAQIKKYEGELLKLMPSDEANERTYLLPREKSEEKTVCCSATLQTSLAVISLITAGVALMAASTLVYKTVVIATAVIGALMIAYGLYLAIRMLCQRSEEKTMVNEETVKTASYASLFDRLSVSTKKVDEDDVEPLEEIIDKDSFSLSRYFSTCCMR